MVILNDEIQQREIIAKYIDSKDYADLRKAIIDSLQTVMAQVPKYYIDIVDRYMFLWATAKALEDDIKIRGVSVFWSNGENQHGYKKNDSIAELNRTSKQMSEILIKNLGINPVTISGEDFGEEL